ncbi:ABC transporter permease [Thermorudis peleae]|uniref:ABC transporter permease n=1 Tax=Thermorudis peleae TaxID=1382356 RepID=UPI000A725713|nr:ABC transporter permease subunit [Thermorudis peleae]
MISRVWPFIVHRQPLRHVRSAWWIDLLLAIMLVLGIYGIIRIAERWTAPLTPTTAISLSPWVLPQYALFSLSRMALAYVLALSFSLLYARIAVASKATERVLVPLLDILQSIPILSFMPGVVLALVTLFPHRSLGTELAAIVLIFTSQAWNLAFSFYQSLITIPQDFREVARLFRLTPWERFTRLELPFGLIPLLWNSMMSWAGGWFFLMASEQFTLGQQSFLLPGLGAYLKVAADRGDLHALGLGLLALIIVIVLLDQFLWRPLLAWADRFKVEQTTGLVTPSSWVLEILQRSLLLTWARDHLVAPTARSLDRLMNRIFAGEPSPASSDAISPPGTVWRWTFATFAGLGILLLIGWGVRAAGHLLIALPVTAWATIAQDAGLSFLRVAASLLIAVIWTVPVGVAVGLSPRWAPKIQPIVQMVASIPATALFPALLLLLLHLPGGLDVAAIALMLLGTQWYVLFNVIAGAMAIPNDLKEAAAIYHLTGWHRWRILILPAIFPFLITGLITAAGGAWNATIVAEYVTFQDQVYQTSGLGALIAASANAGNYPELFAATLTMAVVVVLLNRAFWRRLYRLAATRFRLD